MANRIEQSAKYILCINKYKSLTEAAKVLGITQPALSLNLANIEKQLGYPIFNRKRVPLTLTEEGQIYIDYIRRQISLQDDYTRKINDLHGTTEDSLIIGAPSAYVGSILVDAIIKFSKEFPKCKLTIKEAPVTELIKGTEDENMDFFICTSGDLPPQLEKTVIKEEKLYLCIPRPWPINNELRQYQVKPGETGECMNFDSIDGLPLITLPSELPLQKETDYLFSYFNLQPERKLLVNQARTGLKLAAKGLGMVVVTDETIADVGCVDEVCIYNLPAIFSGRDLYIVRDSRRYLSAACSRMMEIIKERKNPRHALR